MEVIQKIRAAAKEDRRRIVLPEGGEVRTVKAAAILEKEGLAEVVLLGNPDEIGKVAREHGVDLLRLRVVDPAKDGKRDSYAKAFFELRKHKGIDEGEAARLMADPIHFGTMMLHTGDVDGFLAGAVHATADTLRPALQIIRRAPGLRAISSFFIMIVPNTQYGQKGVFIFADCAINIDPPAVKLAHIAISSARAGAQLCGLVPRVAMLSFSTKDSAQHELVDKVKEATRIAKENAPDLEIDGEMQADAALVPEVGNRKAPGSPVAGVANVLVFPDLEAANIGYKLVQRLAGAEAIGPILTGLNKPVNDLSRGCSVDDIVNLAAVTMVQAGSLSPHPKQGLDG